jgi:transketolase
MGSTHHAIEDYGVLLALQNMKVYVPAFADDVAAVVDKMAGIPHPAYLRLGRCEKPKDFVTPPYAPWRMLLPGRNGVMIVIGPSAGGILEEASHVSDDERPQVWALSELPLALAPPPDPLLESVEQSSRLFVVEEHVAQGSAGQMLAHTLMERGVHPRLFRHFHAEGYPSGLYGSQSFHRKENGLDASSVMSEVRRSLGAG